MPITTFLSKELKQFPPYLVEGESWKFIIRRFYLKHSESISAMLVVMIFTNFVVFCGQQNKSNPTFRAINTVISLLICIDVVIKVSLIRRLYKNENYYGIGFIVLDVLSGPISLLFNISNYTSQEDINITIADILLLLRIFCLERIRLLIKDVCYILYVSRYINYALLLTFYVYSFIAYSLFQQVSPKYFRNIFKSMLAMFQVLTLDSWNLLVNQSVSSVMGQYWSCFFIFFILFMFFYFINLLLGAFVSYYSNPHLRRNFEYDYANDEQLNPEVNQEHKRSIDIKSALILLKLDQSAYDIAKFNWGLAEGESVIYLYIVSQLLFQLLLIIAPSTLLYMLFITIEQMFGIYLCISFVLKLTQYREFKNNIQNSFEEKQIEEISAQAEELSVRRYVVIIILLSGPIATAVDIISIILSLDEPNIRYGPALRVLSVLAILYVQRLIYKFIEVVPGVMHILIFIAGILFTLAIIGHQFLSQTNVGYPLFASLTDSYMFMLQVVTFDSWGDVARIVIHKNGIFFVLYFLFLTIFVGFFLMNMLIGVMATMTQPKTQELFEKDHLMRQRVNEKSVRQLHAQIVQYQAIENQQLNSTQQQLKQLLEDFNNSKGDDKMYIIVDDVKYEVTTKNFILYNDESSPTQQHQQ